MKFKSILLALGLLLPSQAMAQFNPYSLTAPPSVNLAGRPYPTLTVVTPEMYGAVGNGIANDADEVEDAINSGFPVWLKEGATYNLGTSGIMITHNQPIIYGNNAVFTSAATPATNTTGCIIDMEFNTDPWFTYFSIVSTGSGTSSADPSTTTKHLCARSQSGYYNSIFMSNQGTNNIGVWLPHNSVTHTSEYYNLFENMNYFGNSNAGTRPFWFDTGAGADCSQGPNANWWIGGNNTSYTLPGIYRGTGNYMTSTFQGWGDSQAAVYLDVPSGCGPGTSNYSNTIGGYFEGARTNQTAIDIHADTREAAILPSYYTSLVTTVTDAGLGTTFITGRTGTFTPTMTNAGVNAPTYSQQDGRYTTDSNTVQGSLTVVITNKGTLSGPITFCGLPYPVAALGSNSPGGGTVTSFKGITLDATYTQLSAEAILGTSCLKIMESGSGAAITPAQLTAANFANASEIVINFSYTRYGG